MKKLVLIALFVAVAWCGGTAMAAAQATDSSTVTINVAVSATAKLTLNGVQGSALTVNFPDADPDTSPTLTAAPIAVVAKGKTSAAGHITLTVQASQVLTSGTDTIPLTNITWGANGNLSAGILDTAAVTIGDWLGSGNRSGSHTYVLANSWTYATGNYSTVVTYTLTAP